MSAFKSAADLKREQAAKAAASEAAGDGAEKFDDMTLYELRRTLSKINLVVASVQAKSDQIKQSRFPLFAELMDIYYAAAKANIAAGHNFADDGVQLSPEQQKNVDLIVRLLFSGDEIPAADAED
ncbi:MAG: hypothetical protein J0H82_09185 [Alphaproteobacteria bacterium]|jgi:hypothetical protein|nr:hypothetical protein [Alphaproteobacteria bacterium]